MAAKVRHHCERCGLEAVLERAGRFRDEDFLEIWHDLMEVEHALKLLRREHARLELRYFKVLFALEHAEAAIGFEQALREAEGRIKQEESCPF